MFQDGGREGVRQEQQLWSGGWVGGAVGWLMTLWGEHLAALSLQFSPHGRHYCFCKLEQPNFSQIPESALYIGTIKYRAKLGRYPERLPADQKYVLVAPQAPPCYGLSILPLAEEELP